MSSIHLLFLNTMLRTIKVGVFTQEINLLFDSYLLKWYSISNMISRRLFLSNNLTAWTMAADQLEFLMSTTNYADYATGLWSWYCLTCFSNSGASLHIQPNISLAEFFQFMLPRNPSTAAQPFFTVWTNPYLKWSTCNETVLFQSIHCHFIFSSVNYQNAFKGNTYLNKRKSL